MLDYRPTDPQRHKNLTIFPLVAEPLAEFPYLLLADALEHDTLRIEEIGSGTVPQLVTTNDGARDVLILDGEQLLGARQNRMTNRSIILPAKTRTTIPVSCMEQSRWHFVTDKFTSSRQHSPSKVRRHARKAEAMYAARYGRVDERVLSRSQGEVWSEISQIADKLGVGNDSDALDDFYTQKREDISAWIEAFPLVDNQVGLLAFLGGEPLGTDVIGSQDLYARLHERLLRGYVMDALAGDGRREERDAPSDRRREEQSSTKDLERLDPKAFLAVVRRATRIEAPVIGRGIYSVLLDGVLGGELVDNERLVHLSAFPDPDTDQKPRRGRRGHGRDRDTEPPTYRSGPRVASPSQRRGWHRRRPQAGK